MAPRYPFLRIFAHSIITALKASIAMVLESTNQSQLLTGGLTLIGQQQLIKMKLPGLKRSKELDLRLIFKLGRIAAKYLANRIARDVKLTAEFFNGSSPNKMLPTNTCNGIHALHPQSARSMTKQAL